MMWAVWSSQTAGIAKGSGSPRKEKVGKITQDQLRQIAEVKMPDLNAHDVEAAMNILAGTARSMGVTVE
jgi:large subunit ribosomal protein L11